MLVRDAVKALSDGELLMLWNEADEWERAGVLSEHAGIRLLFERLPMAQDDWAVPATWLTSIAHEVWRECAVRSLPVGASDGR